MRRKAIAKKALNRFRVMQFMPRILATQKCATLVQSLLRKYIRILLVVTTHSFSVVYQVPVTPRRSDFCRSDFCRATFTFPVATFDKRRKELPIATLPTVNSAGIFAVSDICRSRHLPVVDIAGRDILSAGRGLLITSVEAEG